MLGSFVATHAASSTKKHAATILILASAYALIGWSWLISDWAWFHVELFSVSEYVWGGKQVASIGAQFRALFDWHTFDVSPYRLRIVSDFVEIIDAVTRPALRGLFGLHPSASVVGITIAAVIPAICYRAMQRLGLRNVQAALLVLLLASTIGFLSCFVPYIRPAKKLALLGCCLVPYLCLLLQDRPNRKLYALLFGSLFLGFFADETCYALLPVSLLLLARPMILRRSWVELGGFVALLLAFVATARVILPQVYATFGESGPRTEAVAGQVVIQLLGYLLEPRFYAIALNDLGTSGLASFGIVDAPTPVVVAFLALLFCVLVTSLILHRRTTCKQPVMFWNVAVFSGALVVLSFSLTMFDWFNNPYSSNYIGALTYYYHSAVAVMAVFWLAAFLRIPLAMADTMERGNMVTYLLAASITGVTLLNIGNFQTVNRVFQILHTYPLKAQSLAGTAWRPVQNLIVDENARSGQITVVAAPTELDAEYAALVRRSMGPRAADFEQALNIYRKAPLGGAQYVQRYVRLFYPGYDIRADVTGMPN